jgi:hypothetical protein
MSLKDEIIWVDGFVNKYVIPVAALRAWLSNHEECSKPDECIPDDKEEAYQLGSVDMLTDLLAELEGLE